MMWARFSKKMWRQILLFALIFALLFSLIAVAQIAFVQSQTNREEISSLSEAGDEVSREIYPGSWDRKGYLQSDFHVSTSYAIVTADGLLVDFEVFVPGLIAQGKPIDEDIYKRPKLIRAETGDAWLVFGKKLKDGSVVAGISDPEQMNGPASLLRITLNKFGESLDAALKVKSRSIDQQIDYAILDEFGGVRDVQTGFPLRVRLAFPDDYKLGKPYRTRLQDGNTYEMLTKPIIDKSSKVVGAVVTFDDIGGQLKVLEEQKRFNLIVAFFAWLVTALGTTTYILTDERRRRRQEISLEEALQAGEGQTVEFKEGIDNPEKIRDVARAIAGFANINPGNIFIGIKDTGEVAGVQLATTKDWDNLQKRIREAAVQLVDPPIRVRVTRLDYQGKKVVRVFVPRGSAPVYYADKMPYIRDITSVSRAGPEDLPMIFRSFSQMGA